MNVTKDRIIEAALKRFSHFGFEKTTMLEIAEDLNFRKGNLYYYYQEKVSLIRDVILHVTDSLFNNFYEIIKKYNGNLVETLISLLDCRAKFLKDYYVLHIGELHALIKEKGMDSVFEIIDSKEVDLMFRLFSKAVHFGELKLENIRQFSSTYLEIIKGVSLLRNVSDILSGMPNPAHVNMILESQKRATELIFCDKINNKN